MSFNKAFNYLQPSASPCAGTVNYMVAMLDACLVTGFNSKSVSTLSVTNNIATVTTATAHGFVSNDIILIASANEAIFNDEFKILTVPTTTTFTFSVTTALTAATGTITAAFAPLNWEKVYSGTNKAVYRSKDVTGTRLYLRIDDTNTLYTVATMYETMTDIDTGTNPTIAYWKKSDAETTAVRPWYLIGNSKTFYLFTDWSATYLVQPNGYAFGDFISIKAGDAYNCMLIGQNVVTVPTYPYQYCDFYSTTQAGYQGLYLARSFSQLGSNLTFCKLAAVSLTTMGITSTPLPNSADNGVHLTPLYMFEYSSKVFRGRMPGIFVPFENAAGLFLSGDKSVVVDGKRYMAIRVTSASQNTYGNCWFALDDDWV